MDEPEGQAARINTKRAMEGQEMIRVPYNYAEHANDINEILLADIALRIQLTPTEYDDAVAHSEAIERWLERDGSPLKGKVLRLYPQGSMAINATISSNQDKEEFDIDWVVELDLSHGSDPEEVLDLLFEVVRGEPGSRYFEVTERNSRCVTVHYSNMHLDLCPAVLREDQPARTSTMFHHNKGRGERYRHIRNPWGFADWFSSLMPQEGDFARFYEARGLMSLKSEAEPVPEQTPVYQKPRKVVALQLIKRFRNHRHLKRPRKGPPSVVLSKLSVDAGVSFGGLLDELEVQANHLEVVLGDYPIEVWNPRCPDHDLLTDRWPAGHGEQREFYRDVRYLQRQLAALRLARDLKAKQVILADLFGERATTAAFEALRRRFGDLADRGEIKVNRLTAGIAVAASGIAAQPVSSPAVVSAPRHHSHADVQRRWQP